MTCSSKLQQGTKIDIPTDGHGFHRTVTMKVRTHVVSFAVASCLLGCNRESLIQIRTASATCASAFHQVQGTCVSSGEFSEDSGRIFCWPIAWKKVSLQLGKTISTHKKGDRCESINFPGISLLSLPGNVYPKCFEKCREIIELKLDDTQWGFRPGRTLRKFSISCKFLRNL